MTHIIPFQRFASVDKPAPQAGPESHVADPTGLPPAEPDAENVQMEQVLAAWHSAIERLQSTHETLRCEVRRLTDELEIKNKELARKNRLADLGQMASHVAHEVRNSLVPITLYLSMLRRNLNRDPDCLKLVHKIESGFSALEVTVTDLLNFTSNHDPNWNIVAVQTFVREVIEALEPQLLAQQIQVRVDVPARACVSADRDMLRRALVNLLLNALDVLPAGGEITITGYDDGRAFELEVADSGPGIEPQAREKLFEPFFSTKSSGTGLGLAIVERIAHAHGGHVIAQNCPEGGAAFTLRIPRRSMEAAA